MISPEEIAAHWQGLCPGLRVYYNPDGGVRVCYRTQAALWHEFMAPAPTFAEAMTQVLTMMGECITQQDAVIASQQVVV